MSSDLQRVFDRISTRLNNVLCEMKPNTDDSIAGFNTAWDVMRDVFKDEIESEIKPHMYHPDLQAMGDCRICGHVQNKPWHTFRALALPSADKGSAT